MGNRNVNKCSSAEGLWSLQEPSRKARWRSEAGREAWSALTRNGRYTEVPQARYWPNIPTKNSEQDRGDVLRELVWTGVPADMREEVYMSLSGRMDEVRGICLYLSKIEVPCHFRRGILGCAEEWSKPSAM